jgi:hypothetical protein
MKNSSFILKIEKPCSENWSNMTVNDAGKFCSNCQKNVIDFSNCSDDEVIRILEKIEGKVCGRLRKDQLERIYVATTNRKVSPHLNKILAGLFALGMATSSDVKAQHNTNDTVVTPANRIDPYKHEHYEKVVPMEIAGVKQNIISGKIIQSYDDLPIPFAIITIKGSKVGVFSDSTGKFSLTVPDSLFSDTITLQISEVGYQMTEVKVSKLNINTPIIVTLYYEIMMGEMIQYDPPKKKKGRKH